MTCEQMKCERWPDVRENLQSDGFITRLENKCINFIGLFRFLRQKSIALLTSFVSLVVTIKELSKVNRLLIKHFILRQTRIFIACPQFVVLLAFIRKFKRKNLEMVSLRYLIRMFIPQQIQGVRNMSVLILPCDKLYLQTANRS